MSNTPGNSEHPNVLHGILLVDKPVGITSHDVVDEVRRVLRVRRIGHAGTLDPIANGLLVVLLGEATKISEYLQGADKQYEGTLKLGFVSDTYDSTGQVQDGPSKKYPSLEDIQDLADELTGRINQIPPPYSAKKVGGKKLYEYARKGQPVEVESRTIDVHDFQILEAEGEDVEFGIECSSGTYVRALVHELGKRTKCGAVLTSLRRTVSGSFDVEDSISLDELKGMSPEDDALRQRIIPIRKAMPTMSAGWLGPGAEDWLRRGQSIPSTLVELEPEAGRPTKGTVLVLCRMMGDAVALARVDPVPLSAPPRSLADAPGPWYQPIKIFDIPPA